MLRSIKACSSCHTRKVRCDMEQVGLPCTKCREGGFDCTMHDRKRRQTKATPRQADDNVHIMAVRPAIPHGVPEHHMLHKFPFYSLFRNMAPDGRLRLAPHEQNPGVFPMPLGESFATQTGPGRALSPYDTYYLLQKGALQLPPRQYMDVLVADYFRLFHASFPLVDREDFLARYRQTDSKGILAGQGPSLLLLQAIMFTSVPASTDAAIEAMGFMSRRHARSSLYDRCRCLYNLSYEPDDIPNIQTLLLMSQYFPSMDGQKHTWLWAHQAITLAQGIGLHRDPGASAPQRRLWSRIWWICVIRDRLIALGTRRPLHINSLDCSIPFPTPEDLAEVGDSPDDVAVKSLFIDFTKLCHYMEGVLSLPLASQEALPEQITLCQDVLDRWHEHMEPTTRRPSEGSEAEQGKVVTLFATILKLLFNTVLIVLRQSGSRLDEIPEGERKPPSPAVQVLADESTRLINSLMELDMIQACPTFSVTTTLPVIAFYLHCLQMPKDSPDNKASKLGFRDCLRFFKQLGDIHWHAGFYHDFFQMLAARAVAESNKRPSTEAQASSSRRRRHSHGDKQGMAAGQNRDEPRNPSEAVTSSEDLNTVAARHPTGSLPGQSDPGPSTTSPSAQHLSASMTPQDHTLIPPPSFDFSLDDIMSIDEGLFDGWLEDYSRMQTVLPSA